MGLIGRITQKLAGLEMRVINLREEQDADIHQKLHASWPSRRSCQKQKWKVDQT